MKILSGDIGGTKTRLALFDTRNGELESLNEQTYPSRRYDSLDTVVRDFLEQIQVNIPTANGQHYLFTFKRFLHLQEPTYTQGSRTFNYQTVMFE